jgi:hypothetical protein
MPGARSATGAAAKAMLAWVAILGLAVVVVYLVSERNARTWSLAPEDGRLVVKKGLFFPMGRTEFKSSDPVLAKVYAPLVPPPSKPLPAEQAFADQGELDRELFDLLSEWAREDVASADPARLERGLGYLERAMELPSLSASQRDSLAALRAESGYYEARRLLEKARAELSEAAEKLRLTAGSRSPHALDAGELLKAVGPAVDATTAAVRAAGGARTPVTTKEWEEAEPIKEPAARQPPASPPDGRPADAPASK